MNAWNKGFSESYVSPNSQQRLPISSLLLQFPRIKPRSLFLVDDSSTPFAWRVNDFFDAKYDAYIISMPIFPLGIHVLSLPRKTSETYDKLVGRRFYCQSSVYQRVIWQGSTSNSSSFLVCLTRWLVPWGVQTIASWSVMRHWHGLLEADGFQQCSTWDEQNMDEL